MSDSLADCHSKKKRKEAEIYQALNSDPVDVAALRRMAISEGGLLVDEIRCRVWPKLLNVNTEDLPPPPGKSSCSPRRDLEPLACGWRPGPDTLLLLALAGRTRVAQGNCSSVNLAVGDPAESFLAVTPAADSMLLIADPEIA